MGACLLKKSLKRRTLETAATSVGGRRRLRLLLGVRAAELQAWLSGTAEPSPEVFMRAVEILLQHLEEKDREG